MNDPVLLKYVTKYAKLFSESTIMAFIELPNICNNYMERFIKFSQLIGKYKSKKVTDQKKCVGIAKKIESSTEYIDFLENCLVHKFKEIHKIYKNYPKRIKKIIAVMAKIAKHSTVKLKKLKKENGDKEKIKQVTESLDNMNEEIKKMAKENDKFESFLKKNKKELEVLKKNNIRAYITFYIIRYPLGCFVLP
jgi:septal ring factor EnvC (AmiA/AmiB activator)